MSLAPRTPRDSLLDAHLDSQLDATAQREFDARLAADPALRRAVELQQAIDASLRRSVQLPAADALLARIEAAQAAGYVAALRRQQRMLRVTRYAIAAAIVLCIGSLSWWQWSARPQTRGGYGRQPWRSLETVYRDETRDGFTADWECRTEQDFAAVFKGRFAQALLLATPPADVRSLGLSYCNSLSPRTVHLLARVRGEPVIVFVDSATNDKPQSVSRSSGLHIFRRDLGKVVLYELTPLERPMVLDLFYDPEPPATQPIP